nr:MAG TPA: hypothetical protein [Caudoviricetes sp.]
MGAGNRSFLLCTTLYPHTDPTQASWTVQETMNSQRRCTRSRRPSHSR